MCLTAAIMRHHEVCSHCTLLHFDFIDTTFLPQPSVQTIFAIFLTFFKFLVSPFSLFIVQTETAHSQFRNALL